MPEHGLTEISKSFFVDPDYRAALDKLGLTSLDAVFSFQAAQNLSKKNLAPFRMRLQFEIDLPGSTELTTVFLKRYNSPPVAAQISNWLAARGRKSCAMHEYDIMIALAAAGIGAPRPISCGEQWDALFEKRSFILTVRIPDAKALERKLPRCFNVPATKENVRRRREFIMRLARFIKQFHETGYRHRDLYFSHIFYGDKGGFFLIDLARVFKPLVLGRRFQIKDLAQVYYSAPGRYFSRTDRLRFYLTYAGRSRLTGEDKGFVREVINKAQRIARREKKHGRQVPFEN